MYVPLPCLIAGGVPQKWWVYNGKLKILSKWMMWGYPYFRKPPYAMKTIQRRRIQQVGLTKWPNFFWGYLLRKVEHSSQTTVVNLLCLYSVLPPRTIVHDFTDFTIRKQRIHGVQRLWYSMVHKILKNISYK